MGESAKIEKVRTCVLDVSRDIGVSRKDIDSDGDGEVSDIEAAEFYFANDEVRALCFGEVGLRHPARFLGHTDAEKAHATLVRTSLIKRADIVKAQIDKERRGLQTSLLQDLKLYLQLTSEAKGVERDKSTSLLMTAGAIMEKADGRHRIATREGLPPGMLTYESVIMMERDARAVGSTVDRSLAASLRKRIERKIGEFAKFVPGTDAYYAHLAKNLGRHLRKTGFGLKSNIGKAEYTGLQAIKKGRGSCTEYAYVMYMLLRAAGIPKEKIGVVSESDVGTMAGQRVGHLSLAIRVSKSFRKSGYYLVDFKTGLYDGLPSKAEVGNSNGLVAIYLGSKAAVVSRKGKHWEAYRLAHMAVSLWPSKTTYRFLISVLQNAMESGVSILSISDLKDLQDKVQGVYPSDSEARRAMQGLINRTYNRYETGSI